MNRSKVDKSVQFIAKLLKMTLERELKWQATEGRGSDAALLAGRALMLSKYVVSEGYWSRIDGHPKVFLDVFDMDKSEKLFSFVDVEGLPDLYEAASFEASKIEDFIDEVLKE